MTDYEILYEVLSDCFWDGARLGVVPDVTAAQAAVTMPRKIFELLDRLGFSMMNGDIVLDHQEYRGVHDEREGI